MTALAIVTCSLLSALLAAYQHHVDTPKLLLITGVGLIALWWMGWFGLRQAAIEARTHRRNDREDNS